MQGGTALLTWLQVNGITFVLSWQMLFGMVCSHGIMQALIVGQPKKTGTVAQLVRHVAVGSGVGCFYFWMCPNMVFMPHFGG